jgi:uncharacterized protein YidB (DUF937 family)
MHGFASVMTPNHTTVILTFVGIVMLVLCCGVARCLVKDEYTMLPAKYDQARQQGKSKKSDDKPSSAASRGFGDWNAAASVANTSATRLDMKIKNAAVSGNLNVIKNWVSEVENNKALSLDVGDSNDRTVLHLAAKRYPSVICVCVLYSKKKKKTPYMRPMCVELYLIVFAILVTSFLLL